jgi:predicted metalloprotease
VRWLCVMLIAVTCTAAACNDGGEQEGDEGSPPTDVETTSTIEEGEPTEDVGEQPSELESLLQELEEQRFEQEPTQAEPATIISENEAGDPSVDPTAQYVEAVIKHADTIWTNWFTSNGYEEPWVGYQIIRPGTTYTSRCTLPDGTRTYDSDFPNAVYCAADANQVDQGMVILPVSTMTKMWTGNIFEKQVSSLKRVGDFEAAVIVAHEFGHHIQDELTEQTRAPAPPNPNRELIADCFAGVWAYSVFLDNYLEPGDLDEAVNALGVIGDELGSHGTNAERQNAFLIGYSGTTEVPGGGVPARCIENYWTTG